MELLLDGLTKTFGEKLAVDNVSASLQPGMHALLGANGAGKTTLMRMLGGILEPSGGGILYDGENIFQMGGRYRDMLGYLPQAFGYYPGYTAEDMLLYLATLKGLPKELAKRRSRDLIETVGLSKVADHKIKTFSGGMKQHLGIAQALLNDPAILILDEPTSGLDPKERVRLRNLLSEFANDRIVLLSTHIVSDVEAVADSVLLMKEGRLLFKGKAEELSAQAEGKVWEVQVQENQLRRYEQSFNVANLYRNEGRLILRIISENPPRENAVPCRAGLEDVYLYYFPAEKE